MAPVKRKPKLAANKLQALTPDHHTYTYSVNNRRSATAAGTESFQTAWRTSGWDAADVESMWTTSRMVGRAVLASSTHAMATL